MTIKSNTATSSLHCLYQASNKNISQRVYPNNVTSFSPGADPFRIPLLAQSSGGCFICV